MRERLRLLEVGMVICLSPQHLERILQTIVIRFLFVSSKKKLMNSASWLEESFSSRLLRFLIYPAGCRPAQKRQALLPAEAVLTCRSPVTVSSRLPLRVGRHSPFVSRWFVAAGGLPGRRCRAPLPSLAHSLSGDPVSVTPSGNRRHQHHHCSRTTRAPPSVGLATSWRRPPERGPDQKLRGPAPRLQLPMEL